MTWVPALLAFVAVSFGIIALALLLEAVRTLLRRRDVRNRLDAALDELQQQAMLGRKLFDEATIRKQDADTLLAHLPVFSGAAAKLRGARLDWSPLTLLLIVLGFAAAGFFCSLIARLPLFLAAAVALGFGVLPYWYVGYRRRKLLRRFEEQLPNAMDYLARAVRAGHPLSAGIQMISEELADPLGSEFRTLFDQQRFGVPLEEALLSLCDRVEVVDIRIFATSIIVQREVGGASFGELLDNMAETVRVRFAIRREINVYTAQGRLSGMVVGLAPLVVGLGVYIQDPSYVRVLFEHPFGRMLTVIAVLLQFVGFFWVRRVVNVEI